MKEYMISLELPETLDAEFLGKITEQREAVNQLFTEGVMRSYSLSVDRAKLWLTMLATDKKQADSILNKLPLTSHMRYEINELLFNEQVSDSMLAIHLN